MSHNPTHRRRRRRKNNNNNNNGKSESEVVKWIKKVGTQDLRKAFLFSESPFCLSASILNSKQSSYRSLSHAFPHTHDLLRTLGVFEKSIDKYGLDKLKFK